MENYDSIKLITKFYLVSLFRPKLNRMESQDAKDDGEEDRSVPASSKKADKKAARGLAILKRDTGLGESEDVTSNIFVCNAGLVTGCSSSGMFIVFLFFTTSDSISLIIYLLKIKLFI